MTTTYPVPPYDPRFDRGQSVTDAQQRYLHQDGYTLTDLEADLDRLFGITQ